MVWDILEATTFVDNVPLRALYINNFVEAIYQLAPNYWEQAGDLAIGGVGDYGVGGREYQRLAVPTSSDLYLVNDKDVTNLPVWRTINDIFLLPDDRDQESVGSTFVTSTVLIRRPQRTRTLTYNRTEVDSWERVGSESSSYIDPLIVVENFPDSDAMRLVYDSDNKIVRLFCVGDCRVTMLVSYSNASSLTDNVVDFFPSNSDIGLSDNVNEQERSFEISSTGASSSSNFGFELIDVDSFFRDDFYNDYALFLYVVLFYRY